VKSLGERLLAEAYSHEIPARRRDARRASVNEPALDPSLAAELDQRAGQPPEIGTPGYALYMLKKSNT
jgi:hypothetical protein